MVNFLMNVTAPGTDRHQTSSKAVLWLVDGASWLKSQTAGSADDAEGRPEAKTKNLSVFFKNRANVSQPAVKGRLHSRLSKDLPLSVAHGSDSTERVWCASSAAGPTLPMGHTRPVLRGFRWSNTRFGEGRIPCNAGKVSTGVEESSKNSGHFLSVFGNFGTVVFWRPIPAVQKNSKSVPLNFLY